MIRGRTRRSAALVPVVAAVVAAVVVGAVLGWWLFLRSAPVFTSVGTPVSTRIAFPSYAAERGGRLVIVHGGSSYDVPAQAQAALWLPGGRVAVDLRGTSTHGYRLLDARGNATGPTLRTDEVPSRAGSRLDVWTPENDPDADHRDQVGSFDSRDLHLVETLLLPGPASHGPEPASDPFQRFYSGSATTIAGSTYAIFSDGNDETSDKYGVVRMHGGQATDVLVGKRITSLRLSSDGAALLALQQRHGDPCGGCVVRQQIVEIDPRTGDLAATYGMPPGYDKTWRVDRLDKVGDRLGVSFVKDDPDGAAQNAVRSPLATWAYDGTWTKVAGSEGARQWWQGRDHFVEERHGKLFAVTVAAGHRHRTLIPGSLEGTLGNHAVTGSVPGSPLRPAS
jgi:hypothetical protein